MTDKPDLDAIEARCNAATEGLWTFEDEERHAAKVRVGNSVICQVVGDSAETLDTANFIAHSRQDIPALTAALRARDRRIAELEAALGEKNEEVVTRLEQRLDSELTKRIRERQRP